MCSNLFTWICDPPKALVMLPTLPEEVQEQLLI